MLSRALFQSSPTLGALVSPRVGTARASGKKRRKSKKKAAAPRARKRKVKAAGKPARLVKGSAAAKAYMAKIRRKKK